MEAPDKIYVEVRHPFGNEFTEMLGFESRGNSDDIEYIRKDTLLEFLDFMKDYHSGVYISADVLNAIERLKEKINSL